ncbi:MAG: carboxypeptidase-like regulatory domain-containing protein, partial [Pyrinomonadaceae bacterium]
MKFFPLATLVFFLLVPNPTSAQSQALDGQIEGTVTDTRGSVIPHAVVTVLNGQTGAKRTGVSNESGIFRFPILSLGTYAVTVEVDGFNRFEQKGIVLNAGHTASITVVLQPGSTEVTVTVTADAAIADASRFEVGRSVSSLEVKNLPLVSRNPYNFALLQPGVNGRMVS